MCFLGLQYQHSCLTINMDGKEQPPHIPTKCLMSWITALPIVYCSHLSSCLGPPPTRKVLGQKPASSVSLFKPPVPSLVGSKAPDRALILNVSCQLLRKMYVCTSNNLTRATVGAFNIQGVGKVSDKKRTDGKVWTCRIEGLCGNYTALPLSAEATLDHSQ